jgi:integrase
MQPGSKLVLRIALVTGQRIGEICGAEKSEFDLDGLNGGFPQSGSRIAANTLCHCLLSP